MLQYLEMHLHVTCQKHKYPISFTIKYRKIHNTYVSYIGSKTKNSDRFTVRYFNPMEKSFFSLLMKLNKIEGS